MYLYADMNECALGNGGCDHQCVNTGGSFTCRCNSGYNLQSDRLSCQPQGGCLSEGGGGLLTKIFAHNLCSN